MLGHKVHGKMKRNLSASLCYGLGNTRLIFSEAVSSHHSVIVHHLSVKGKGFFRSPMKCSRSFLTSPPMFKSACTIQKKVMCLLVF